MENFTPELRDEIHNLMTRLGENERESYLKELEKAFRLWKKGAMGFSELDEMLLAYGHRRNSMDHTDPVVAIADALAEGTLAREEVSDSLYNRIEIVVRLMKN